MIPIHSSVELFFWVAALLALLFPLWKQHQARRITVEVDPGADARMALALGAFLVLYGVAAVLQQPMAGQIGMFLAGIIVPWGLSRLSLSADLRGIALLMATVAFSLHGWDANTDSQPLFSLLLGIGAWQLMSLLWTSDTEQPTLNDSWLATLPALAWLTGLYWISLGQSNLSAEIQGGLLLGLLGITLLLRTLQTLPLPVWNSPLQTAGLLAVVGGLATMLLTRNGLLQPDALKFWPCLYGGGILLAFLAEGLLAQPDAPSKDKLPQVLVTLAVIGLGTLVGSRLFGTLGWVVLAVAFLTLPSPRIAGVAVFFWLARTLVQGFSYQYNLNLTGINLTHTYVTAAQFAGVTLMLLIPAMARSWKQSAAVPLLLTGLAVLLPALSNYFLHAEAAGSLLLALMTGAVPLTVIAPLLLSETEAVVVRPLVPLTLVCATGALATAPLLELGQFATREDQLQVLAGSLVAIGLLVFLLYRSLSGRDSVKVA